MHLALSLDALDLRPQLCMYCTFIMVCTCHTWPPSSPFLSALFSSESAFMLYPAYSPQAYISLWHFTVGCSRKRRSPLSWQDCFQGRPLKPLLQVLRPFHPSNFLESLSFHFEAMHICLTLLYIFKGKSTIPIPAPSLPHYYKYILFYHDLLHLK